MRKQVVAGLLKYLDTDTVWCVLAGLFGEQEAYPAPCSFHEEFPPQLVALQDANWKPLIAWANETFDVNVGTYEGILGTKQPDATVVKLGQVVDRYDQFQLAGACPPRVLFREAY